MSDGLRLAPSAWRRTLSVAAGGGLALFIFIAPARAQDDVQGWGAVFGSGPIAKGSRVLVWFDAHARFREKGDQLDTTILRPGVGWRVSNRLDVWAGYAFVTNHRPTANVQEQRFWQQATYPIGDLAGGRLTGRTRLEQRFREGGDDTGWRLRQSVRWSRPVGGGSVAVVASNETLVAVNDTDWGQNAGFDQNRAFIGLGWQAAPKLRLEGGYMNQHVEGGARPDRDNDSMVLSAFVTF